MEHRDLHNDLYNEIKFELNDTPDPYSTTEAANLINAFCEKRGEKLAKDDILALANYWMLNEEKVFDGVDLDNLKFGSKMKAIILGGLKNMTEKQKITAKQTK